MLLPRPVYKLSVFVSLEHVKYELINLNIDNTLLGLLNMKMEAVYCSETAVAIYQATVCHIPGDLNLTNTAGRISDLTKTVSWLPHSEVQEPSTNVATSSERCVVVRRFRSMQFYVFFILWENVRFLISRVR